MADEIQYRHSATGSTLYFTVRNVSNQYWDAENSAPAWETMVVAAWSDYAISLTESPADSYVYVGTFPTDIAPGRYAVDVFDQVDSVPLITDTKLATITFDWDGAAEMILGSIDSTGTDEISAAKALEIILAILGGNASYDSTTRVLTVYGRDGSTVLWTVKISATVYGTRTDSTKA